MQKNTLNHFQRVSLWKKWIAGTPVPQGSMRTFMVQGRPVITHSNPNLKKWRKVLAASFQEFAPSVPGDLYYGVALTFVLHRPKYHSTMGDEAPKAPHVKPDLDKLIRAVLDALTDAKVISDDAHICSIEAKKCYGEEEGVEVCFEELQY